jgi:formamidopyrimidine-DNA glycosylase
MPELADVAGFRRLVARHLHHLDGIELVDATITRNATPAAVHRLTADRDVDAVERRGKWLVIHLDDAALVLHFGMTGALVLADGAALEGDVRAVLCGDAELRLRDRRKLGGLWVATDHDAVADIIGPQGPDAARLSTAELRAALHGRRGAIKPVLMDQSVIAGLGNTLSDEVLWAAGIDPRRLVPSLGGRDVARLHAAIRDRVRRAARAGAIPRSSGWLASQRSASSPTCPRCGHALRHAPIGGRTAWWCPHCQAA